MDVGQGTGTAARGVSRVLVLAGTPEAIELAGVLQSSGFDVVTSLDDADGLHPAPGVRVHHGSFGAAPDLIDYLRDQQFDVVVDATPPFGAPVPVDAAIAALEMDVHHCRLTRDEWRPQPGDQWIDVADVDAAARTVATIGRRVLLTIGDVGLDSFATCVGPWFLVRTVAADDTVLPNSLSIRGTPPFTFEREMEILTSHDIDTIVTENSGGQAAIAKLEAARSLGLTVVMVRRPLAAEGITTVLSVSAATEWVRSLAED